MAFWCRLSFSILIAIGASGCPANRVCESSADCPEPDQQLCVAVDDSGSPAEVCEGFADTDCVPMARGCRCIVGSWAHNELIQAGDMGILCID